MTESTDPGVRKAAAAYFTNVDLLAEKQAKAFQDGVPGARVIRQRGTHYIFISNESDVLREMGAFLAGLKRSEEHTSELQSLTNLVCRLLLEKKKKKNIQKEAQTNEKT